jgi:GST-like protein
VREEADAVGEDVAAFGDRQLFHHIERRVGFEAGDDPAAGGIEGSPPGIVVIAEIEDISGARLDRHLLGHGDVVDVGRGDRGIDRTIGIGVVNHVHFGTADPGREPRPAGAALVQARARGIDQVGRLGKLATQPAMGLLHHHRQQVGEHGDRSLRVRIREPPKVWTWNKESGGQFASINRPIAGPTHDKELPVGRHPLQLYSLATPNGVKVTVMLEELLALGHSGAEYDAWLIKIDGDQFGSGFVAVNPNSKIPALMDRSGPKPIRVFESGAILVHLAEKFGAFLPTERPGARRMPVMAVLADGQRALSRRRLRPFLRLCADQDRIRHRPLRHGGEAPARRARPRLAENEYLAGSEYTIADMAVWPWYGALAKGWLYGAGEFLRCRTTRTCSAGPTRSASARPSSAAAWSTASGDPASQLHERHDASDFETKTQDRKVAAALVHRLRQRLVGRG